MYRGENHSPPSFRTRRRRDPESSLLHPTLYTLHITLYTALFNSDEGRYGIGQNPECSSVIPEIVPKVRLSGIQSHLSATAKSGG